jgi:hypothetical protein
MSISVISSATPLKPNCSPYDYECIKEKDLLLYEIERKNLLEQQQKMDELRRQRQQLTIPPTLPNQQSQPRFQKQN